MCQAVIVAIIGGIFAREQRRRKGADKRVEERAELRAQESRLSMALMSAAVKLGIATALAVEEGKANGEMADAKTAAASAQKDYYDFINGVAASKITNH
jgi:hypothetical protein